MRTKVLVLALLLASCKAAVDEPPAITIQSAWARATVGPGGSSAAYFTIANTGGTDALLSVTSPAGDASLHSTTMDDGVMRMRPLPRLDVPAKSSVQLKPGGTHVMLMGLKAPLAAGGTVHLDLKFQRSGDVAVTAPVKASGATM